MPLKDSYINGTAHEAPLSEDYSMKHSIRRLKKVLDSDKISDSDAKQILSAKASRSMASYKAVHSAVDKLRAKYWYNFTAKELEQMGYKSNTELERRYQDLAKQTVFEMSKKHTADNYALIRQANKEDKTKIRLVPNACKAMENPFSFHYKFNLLSKFMAKPFKKILRPFLRKINKYKNYNSVVSACNKKNAFIFSSGKYKGMTAPAFQLQISPREKPIRTLLSAAPIYHLKQHVGTLHKGLAYNDAMQIWKSGFVDNDIYELVAKMESISQRPNREWHPLALHLMEEKGFVAQEHISLDDFMGCVSAIQRNYKKEKSASQRSKQPRLYQYIHSSMDMNVNDIKEKLAAIFTAIQNNTEIPKQDQGTAKIIKQYVGKKLGKKIAIPKDMLRSEDFQEFLAFKKNVSRLIGDVYSANPSIQEPAEEVIQNVWLNMMLEKTSEDKQEQRVQKIAQLELKKNKKMYHIVYRILAPVYKQIAATAKESEYCKACWAVKAKNQALVELLNNPQENTSALKNAMHKWLKNEQPNSESVARFAMEVEKTWCAIAENKQASEMDADIVTALNGIIEDYTGTDKLPELEVLTENSIKNTECYYDTLYKAGIYKDKKILDIRKPSLAAEMLREWNNAVDNKKSFITWIGNQRKESAREISKMSLSSRYSNNHPNEQWARMLYEAGAQYKKIFQINFWDKDFVQALNSSYPIVFYDEKKDTVVYFYPKEEENDKIMHISTDSNNAITTKVAQILKDPENTIDNQAVGIKNFTIKEVKMSSDGTKQTIESEKDLSFAFYVKYPDYQQYDFSPESMSPLLDWVNNVVLPDVDKLGHQNVLTVSNCHAGVNRSQCALTLLDSIYRQKLMFNELRQNKEIGSVDELTLAKMFNNICQENSAKDLLALITQITAQGNGMQYSQYRNTANALTMQTQDNIVNAVKSRLKTAVLSPKELTSHELFHDVGMDINIEHSQHNQEKRRG